MIELCSDYVVRKSSESLSLKHLELLVTYEMFWLILGYTGYTHTQKRFKFHMLRKSAQLWLNWFGLFCLHFLFARLLGTGSSVDHVDHIDPR